jgi:hypothetical protein
VMQLTRRAFIASLTAALVAPRMALPAPQRSQPYPLIADELVAFHESYDCSVVAVRLRVVLIGAAARQALAKDPHLWSAVVVKRRLT